MNSLDILARAVSLSRENASRKETPFVSRSLYPATNFLGLHYNDHSYSCKAIDAVVSWKAEVGDSSENLAYTSSSDDSDSDDSSSSTPGCQGKVQGTAADHSYSEFKFRIRCRCQSRHRFGSLLMCDYCGYSQHKNCVPAKDLLRRPYFCYKCLYSPSDDVAALKFDKTRSPSNAHEDLAQRLKYGKIVRRFKRKSKLIERKKVKQSDIVYLNEKDDESEWAITSTVDINSNERNKISKSNHSSKKKIESQPSPSISPDSTTCPKQQPCFNQDNQKRKQSTPKKAIPSTKFELNSPVCGKKRKKESEASQRSQGEPAKKLTREEKKVQHYMRIFEQMEKKEKTKRSPTKSTGSDIEFHKDVTTKSEIDFDNETGDTTVSSTTEIFDQTSLIDDGSFYQNGELGKESAQVKESVSSDEDEKLGNGYSPENDNITIDFSKMQFKKPTRDRSRPSPRARGRGKKTVNVSPLTLQPKQDFENPGIPTSSNTTVTKNEPHEVETSKPTEIAPSIKIEQECEEKVATSEQPLNDSTSSTSDSSSSSSSSSSDSEDDERCPEKEPAFFPEEMKQSTPIRTNSDLDENTIEATDTEVKVHLEPEHEKTVNAKPPTLNVAKSLKSVMKRREKAKRNKLNQDSSKLVLAKYHHRYAPTPKSRYQTRASRSQEENQQTEFTCRAIETNVPANADNNWNNMLPDEQKRVQSTSVKCIKMKKMLLNEWLSEQALEKTEKQVKTPEPVPEKASVKSSNEEVSRNCALNKDFNASGETYIASAKKRWLQKAIESSYSDALTEASHLCNNASRDVNSSITTPSTPTVSDPGRDESLENVFFEPPVSTKKKVSLVEYKKRREDEGLTFRRKESAENSSDCQNETVSAKEHKPLLMPLEAIKNRAQGLDKVCKIESLNDRKKIMQENVKRELEKMKLRHVGKDGIENLRRELEQERPRHFSGSDVDNSPMRHRTSVMNQTLVPVQIQPSYCIWEKIPSPQKTSRHEKISPIAPANGSENCNSLQIAQSGQVDTPVSTNGRLSRLDAMVTQKDCPSTTVQSVKKKRKRKHLDSKSPPPPPPPPPRPPVGLNSATSIPQVSHSMNLDQKEISSTSSGQGATVVLLETPNTTATPILGQLPFIQSNPLQPVSLLAQRVAPAAPLPIPLIIQSIPTQQALVLRSNSDLSQ